MPGPRAVQNLQMPHPQDWQGGQMPHSSPVGVLGTGGIDWCIMHLSINGLLRMDGGGWGGPTYRKFDICQLPHPWVSILSHISTLGAN